MTILSINNVTKGFTNTEEMMRSIEESAKELRDYDPEESNKLTESQQAEINEILADLGLLD